MKIEQKFQGQHSVCVAPTQAKQFKNKNRHSKLKF